MCICGSQQWVRRAVAGKCERGLIAVAIATRRILSANTSADDGMESNYNGPHFYQR